MSDKLGFEVGEVCNRNGCLGVIVEKESERGCSCHINPPCSRCTTPREECPECGWRLTDEETSFNNYLVGPVKDNGAWTHYRLRPLDNTKIDWHSKHHTHFSMIKEGVYPQSGNADADRKTVLEKVNGTFGGRFEQFGGGRFKFIAYTD